MTEEPPNNGSTPPPTITPVAVLNIFLMPDDSVEVQGPVDNQIFAYGLLLKAHDRLKDYHDQKRRSGILTVPPGTKV